MTKLATTTDSSLEIDDRLIDALIVGPWRQSEFQLAVRSIEPWHDFPHVESVPEACRALAQSDVAPELILIAQPLPGLVRQNDVDQLQQLAPLARIVVVVGSWCEGGLRTDSPPTGVLRLYWYELASWWHAAQDRLSAGKFPSWSLPLDHLQAGRFCSDASCLDLSHTVAVHADDFSVFETLAESLRLANAIPNWANREPFTKATAGIFDGGQLDAQQLEQLREFCTQVEGKVTLLLDFPRREHYEKALKAGASTVLGKPYVVEELLASLV